MAKEKPIKRKPRRGETTGQQTISYIYSLGELSRDYTRVGTYKQLRAVRKDPTVQLARGLLISCIQAGSWNIESDEGVRDDVTEFMEHILSLREDFLYNAIAYGKCDYGWQGFEKLFKIRDNKIIIEALKPLLHDMTCILVTPKGHFNGYRQKPIGGVVTAIDVPIEKCLHIAFGIEAGNLYGTPLLENIRKACDDWDDCNDGAKRYDSKIAGANWKMRYPPGTATIDGEAGVDNRDIATKAVTAMQSGGSVVLPSTTIDNLQELTSKETAEAYKWDIDLIESKGDQQASFGKRLAYLDSQKVRGLLMPERSLLEGEHGTKAEAGEHIGLMITNMQEIDKAITRMINEQVVNQLLLLNFGDALVDKVRLVSAPLVDTQITFLREVYKDLKDPNIDMGGMREKLNIPTDEGGSEGIKKETDRKEQLNE